MPDYDDIFADLGRFVLAHESLNTLAKESLHVEEGETTLRSLPTIAWLFDALVFDSNDGAISRNASQQVAWAIPGIEAAQISLRESMQAWLRQLAETENLIGAEARTILDSLARSMREDDESIEANTISAEEPLADAANIGNPQVLLSLMQVDDEGAPFDSQLCANQQWRLEVSRDALSGRVREGEERWSLLGQSGKTQTIRSIAQSRGSAESAGNFVRDGVFVDWVGDAPDHWDTSLAAGLVAFDDTHQLFGEASMRMSGVGEASISQDLRQSSQALIGGKAYALTLHARAAAWVDGTLSIRVLLNDTPLDGAIALDSSIPLGGWTPLQSIIAIPRLAASDELVLEISTDSAFDADLSVDAVTFSALEAIGAGASLALVQGQENALIGDGFTLETTSDDASPFGVYLRDLFDAELPSASSPTISSILAE